MKSIEFFKIPKDMPMVDRVFVIAFYIGTVLEVLFGLVLVASAIILHYIGL